MPLKVGLFCWRAEDGPTLKIVSMIRIYHNHKLQKTLWHREEEPHMALVTSIQRVKPLRVRLCNRTL